MCLDNVITIELTEIITELTELTELISTANVNFTELNKYQHYPVSLY